HAPSGRAITVEATPLPPVWGDPKLLKLAFNNLIGNAIKYSQPNTPVTVRAWADDDGIWVAVSDYGIGIPETDLPRIFDRFHRAANADGIAGSGIGLHMVRQIVELHGGAITVDSAEGHGSTFTARLRPAPAQGAAK
ncbi:MAG TPA: sensor histidine kinase, partial [Candidatus Omnitrophota bacterium]|nr:sensor histidine kinase [Candidatus Omnitrophota bacterium]